jgi:alpha-1,2-glucosyltransferase
VTLVTLVLSLSSYSISILAQRLQLVFDCSEASLRAFNAQALIVLALTAALCRGKIESWLNDQHSNKPLPHISTYAVHTGLNIGLFPLIFFFSGLYYTDIVSTLVVLVAYSNHLSRIAPGGKTFFNDIWTVLLSVLALTMRQTNVFWVVVYMGGLEAIHTVKTLQLGPHVRRYPIDEYFKSVMYHHQRYGQGYVHDPPLNLAEHDGKYYLRNPS